MFKFKKNVKLRRQALSRDDVQRALKQKPTDEQMNELSDLFKILGDRTRINILWVLDQNELRVCEIAKLLEMDGSLVSHHLAILRDARIVNYRRDGKEVFYMLDDDHITQIYEMGLIHIIHQVREEFEENENES